VRSPKGILADADAVTIMREHNLSVMSLEEYEPNAEFVGRNFNAGEVIQLVLKSRFSRQWLPFDYVQMVMMHEYASPGENSHNFGIGSSLSPLGSLTTNK
jgi:hypothetical protein